MPSTVIGDDDLVFTVTDEDGMICTGADETQTASKSEQMDGDGDIVAVGWYGEKHSGTVSGAYLSGDSADDIAIGAALVVANKISSASAYLDERGFTHAAGNFKQFTKNWSAYPAIAAPTP